LLLCLNLARGYGHPLHLTTVTVYLEETMTRVTVVAHIAHLGGVRPQTGIPSRLRLRLDGTPFRPLQTSVSVDEAGQIITWEGREPRPASVVAMDSPLFPDSPGDSTVVVIHRNGDVVDRAVLDAESPGALLAESTVAFVRRFGEMGIHHILSGIDHVLFIIGLVLVRGSLRGLLAVITAFTIAHSITLSMTVLRIGSLPSRVVEPLIALSIVAVGVENLLSRTLHPERRIWLAFGFGFFHGFGFAGALAEAGLPRDAIPASLTAFNVGVEIGQACIVLLILPILHMLCRRAPEMTIIVTRCASVIIAAAGALWLVERLLV
jgi:hydrogenase/urease accessory protein HupE